jgi:hypothetical protein
VILTVCRLTGVLDARSRLLNFVVPSRRLMLCRAGHRRAVRWRRTARSTTSCWTRRQIRSGITGSPAAWSTSSTVRVCEGYTVNFRFVTKIDTSEASRLTDQQTTTFEDGAGKTFSFVTKSFVDPVLDKEVKGTATAEGKGLKVSIEKPSRLKASSSARRSFRPSI